MYGDPYAPNPTRSPRMTALVGTSVLHHLGTSFSCWMRTRSRLKAGRDFLGSMGNVREGWENLHLQKGRETQRWQRGRYWQVVEEGGFETWVEMSEGAGVLSLG